MESPEPENRKGQPGPEAQYVTEGVDEREWVGIPASRTVLNVWDRTRQIGPVNAWTLIQAVLESHPEYGGGAAEKILMDSGPEGLEHRSGEEWFRGVQAMLDPATVSEIHGRLLIVALSRLEPALVPHLSLSGFLEKAKMEIFEPVDTLFLGDSTDMPPPAETEDPRPPDVTRLHVDNPTDVDLLGRRAFARALAIRLQRMWNQYLSDDATNSFVLHLHGPWGSGKTSLLKLLREQLQPGRPEDAAPIDEKGEEQIEPWVVVDFNAWQHQRLDPPWWSLLTAIYQQGRAQLMDVQRRPFKSLWVGLMEQGWRMSTGRRDVVTFAALALLILGLAFGVVLVVLGSRPVEVLLQGRQGWLPALATFANNADNVSKILALASTLGGGLMLISRSLIPGSARSAQAFLQAAVDPMDRVCRHYRHMVRRIDRPIVVFIDDLDRCQSSYCVSLLEGIQTLFHDPRVMFVISADRRWLYACFEDQYSQFAGTVNEPGRRLGSLFLEKAFQLSVSVPRLTPELRGDYWRYLIEADVEERGQRVRRTDIKVQGEFEKVDTEEDVIALLEQEDADPLIKQVRRQVAVERLASSKLETSTTYFLEPFAPLLEPNPRAMKRLINAYTVHRDLAVLGGLDVLRSTEMREQLALWTIVSLRWPALEEYLIDRVAKRAGGPVPEISALLDSQEVRRVLDGEGIGTQLDMDAIGRLAGLRSSDASAGAVA